MAYVIQRTDVPLFYNEETGKWGGLDDATFYHETGDLPETTCAWAPLASIDQLQFIRLIAEIHMTGAISQEGYEELAESMDLEIDQIDTLTERALEMWDDLKAKL